MLPAANLKHILPTMHAICRDRLSTVFHVLTGALEADTFSLSAQDLSELVPVSYTGFSIIGSSSVQEVHDIGLAAHIVSRVLRAPVLHYFDGVAVGQQLNTVRSLEGENVLKSLVEYAESSLNDHHDTNGHGHIVPGASGISSTSSSVDVINTFERVLDILSPILFKTYRPIEYFGHAHPETLLISLTNLATPMIASTISSHLTTVPSDKIGFLSVRLMRPWSSAYFVKHVPKSVKRVVILDNTTQHDGPSAHGTFYLDVLSAFYGGQSHLAHVPSICTVYFEDESVDGVTEGSIKWLITDLLNDHKNGSKIKIPAVTLHHRHSLDEQEPGLVQAVFFDVLQQQLSTPIPDVADEVVKYLSSDSVSTRTCDDESSPSIQLDVGHKIGNLQSQTEPFLSKVSNLRYNLQPLSPIASLVSKISHSADYIGFHHPALVFIHGSDVLPRKNGIVVVNGPYKTIKQMVDAKMVTKETIHLWIQQNVTLIFIDVEKHVQDFTHFLFKKDTEKQLYVSLILQGAFYKFSSRGDSLHHHQHHHQTSVTLDPAAALHHLKTCIVDKVLDKGVKAGATLIGALEKSLAKAVIVQLDSQNRALLSAIDEIFPLVEHQESSSSSSTFRVSSSLVTQYAASINLTDEEDDDTVDQVAIKHHHHLAWAYLFPEAYQTEKTLRPDITEDAYLVKVSENRRLTPLDYDRNVFHIDFDTSGTELKYEVGEALGVHGHNDPEMVARFLKLYGLEADTVVEFARRDKVGRKKTELRTIEQVFIQLLDVFGKPGTMASGSERRETRESDSHRVTSSFTRQKVLSIDSRIHSGSQGASSIGGCHQRRRQVPKNDQ